MPQDVAIKQVISWIQEDPARLREIATKFAKEADPDLAFEIASNLPVPRHVLRIKTVDPVKTFIEVGFKNSASLQAYAKKLQKIRSEESQFGEDVFTFTAPPGKAMELKAVSEYNHELLPFLRLYAQLRSREADPEKKPITYQELLQTAGGAALCVAHRSNKRIDKLFLESLEDSYKVSLKNQEQTLLQRTPTFNRKEFEAEARKAAAAQIQVKIAEAATTKSAPIRTRPHQQRSRRDAEQH